MMTTRRFLLLSFCSFAIWQASPQTTTPAVPKKSTTTSTAPGVGTGPSLEATKDFIAEMITASPVTFESTYDFHNATSGLTGNVIYRVRNFTVEDCKFKFDDSSTPLGIPDIVWTARAISLTAADPLVVRIVTFASSLNEEFARKNSETTVKTSPEIYMVNPAGFMFKDKAQAERVAKAYIHAIVLCGGGKSQPF